MSAPAACCRLHQREREAMSWLATLGDDQVRCYTGLYSALLSLPHVREPRQQRQHTRMVACNERMVEFAFSVLQKHGLPFPLPAGPAACRCAELRAFTVQKVHMSGSVREGSDVRQVQCGTKSDIDVMFQLGPAAVVSAPSSVSLPEGSTVLVPEPAGTPGFMLLRHPRLSSCLHSGQLTFAGERARHLMDQFGAIVSQGQGGYTGPAVTGKLKQLSVQAAGTSIDVVACVECQKWPYEEFVSRPRLSGQPSRQLVNQLRDTAVFLVPVGFPGSPTEQKEWRISFSRHEYMIFRSMSPAQRRCLVILKYARAVVGEPGKVLKSYYLKTALMWMCETRGADWWRLSNLHTTLLSILDYLELCAQRGRLDCYLWTEVNLFASLSAVRRSELVVALRTVRVRLVSSLLALLADWNGQPVVPLARRLLLGQVSSGAQSDGVPAVPSSARRPLPLASASLSTETDFESLLASLFVTGRGQPDGRPLSLPVWSLLTLLFQTVLSSWMGPSLAAAAEAQRRLQRAEELELGSHSVEDVLGIDEDPDDVDLTGLAPCGWIESMLLVAQHRDGLSEHGSDQDSWFDSNDVLFRDELCESTD